jgi:septum formation topological specificity factor MinE
VWLSSWERRKEKKESGEWMAALGRELMAVVNRVHEIGVEVDVRRYLQG